MPAQASTTRAKWAAVVAVAAIVAASVWVRWPGFTQGGFASHDVAGILYNAMVLQDGGLPYVDTLEVKAPGAFYLAWALAGPEGTDIARFQVWANLWAVLSLVTVASTALLLHGGRSAVAAAAVYACVDAHLDSMDANYVTWAQLPAVLAFATGVAAHRRSGPTQPLGFAVAGALGALAFLIKQPSGGVMLALVWLALRAAPPIGSEPVAQGPGGRPRMNWRNLAWLGVGGLLAYAPLIIQYSVAGALPTLLAAFPVNAWGLKYIAGGGQRGPWPGPVEGALATAHFLGLPLLLASVGAWVPRDWPRPRGATLALVLWLVGALAGASLGGRFYKGYFLAPAAPMALLAATPWGLLGPVDGTGQPQRWPRIFARTLMLIPVLALLVRQVAMTYATRVDRARAHDQGGRIVAAHVARETPQDARIWVWGWHLWDVYPLANRRSASRVYKSWGLLTAVNDDTWRYPARPLRFVDGRFAAMVLEDFAVHPPAYIILGSTVPHRRFTALQALLRRSYTRDRRVRLGRLELWRANWLPRPAGQSAAGAGPAPSTR